MAQNQQLSLFAEKISVNTASNTVSVNSGFVVGGNNVNFFSNGNIQFNSSNNLHWDDSSKFLSIGPLLLLGAGSGDGDGSGIEIGQWRTGNGAAYIDFHSTYGSDLDARIIKATGANGTFSIQNGSNGSIGIDTSSVTRIFVSGNGNVGIGTSSPSQKLEVSSGTIGISGIPSHTNNFITQIGTSSTSNAALSIYTNATLTSNSLVANFYNILTTPKLNSNGLASSISGIWSAPRIESSVGTEALYNYSIIGFAYRNSNNDVSTGASYMYGGTFQAGHNNGSNTTQSYSSGASYGLSAASVNQNGSITNMYGSSYGVNIGTGANRTANATSAYGIYTSSFVGATSGTGTGTLTNWYDAYLSGVTVQATGTVTNKYGIYQAATDHINYFGSSVGIGYTAPNDYAYNGGPSFVVRGLGPSISIHDTSSGGKFAILARTGAGTSQFRIYDGTALADRMIIDSAGNIGIGVTPSAWATTQKAIELGSGSLFSASTGAQLRIAANAYLNANGQFIYKTDGYASAYVQLNGAHQFYSVANGSSGGVSSPTLAMTLNANGNLGINYTNMDALGARLYCYGYSGFGASINGSVSLGSRSNWTSTFENYSGGYGLGVNVSAATGIVQLQSQRFDGTATSYNLALQPLGGNVGIGTNAPAFVNPNGGLVVSNPNAPGIRILSGTANACDMEIYGGTVASHIRQRANLPLVFWTNDTERLRIDNNGTIITGYDVNKTYGQKIKYVYAGYNENAGYAANSTFELCRISRDTVNWSQQYLELDIYTSYFYSGSSKWYIQYDAADSGTVVCREANGFKPLKLYLGSEVTISGTIKYRPVYIDIPAYVSAQVEVRFGYQTETTSSLTGANQIQFTKTYTANTSATLHNGDRHQNIWGGNTGIGYTSPLSRLHVANEIRIGKTDSSQEGGEIKLCRSSDDAAQYSIDVFGSGSSPALRMFDTIGGTTFFNASPTGVNYIKFNPTQQAVGDANALDDYEEGLWTPTIGGNTTYNWQYGSYVKIGRMVFLTLDLSINVKGTGSNTFITGLPFAWNGGGVVRSAGSVAYFNNLNISGIAFYPIIDSQGIYLDYVATAASGISDNPSWIKDGTRVILAVSYQTTT